jgi:glycoprotein endo-alpha-1,2-mannosidase
MIASFILAALLFTATAAQPEPPTPTANAVTSDRVHAFYYAWYGNPETDGSWSHWNHPVILPDKPGEHRYTPPESIGANFYPALGCYSSNDPETIAAHMQHLRQAGIGVLVFSWWGAGDFSDRVVPQLLPIAAEQGIQVAFHIEPYPGRSAASVRENLKYLIDTYGDSPAFYRSRELGNRPLVYLYDSYLIPAQEWATILAPDRPDTIRGTAYDAAMIGLWVKSGDGEFMKEGHFDGFYTYFATEGFTYGSTPANWQTMMDWAKENRMVFIPSVGPGYDDTRIRPWNGKNQRDRRQGEYYDEMFQAALEVNPPIVSITSFNEWHEGTQIEPSVPKRIEDYTYLDFSPLAPDDYLERTRHWVERFREQQQSGR